MSHVNPDFYIHDDDDNEQDEAAIAFEAEDVVVVDSSDDDSTDEDYEDDEFVPVVENVVSVRDKTTSLGVVGDKCYTSDDLMSKDNNEIDGLFCPICMEPWTSQGVHQVWLVLSLR